MKSQTLKHYLVLCKFNIAFWNGFAAAVTYVVAKGQLDFAALIPFIGVLILASGALILNQYQEIPFDGMMERTRERPLPTKKITPKNALILSTAFFLVGEIILYLESGMLAVTFGCLAVFFYNFIYTPLKRKSLMIAIPSSLVGVFPPLIGWAAGDGSWTHAAIYGIATFFFFWQIPHFLLLYRLYVKDYQKAGFGIMVGLTDQSLSQAILGGIALSLLSAACFPFWEVFKQTWICALFLLGSTIMLWFVRPLMKKSIAGWSSRPIFITFNLWVAGVMILMLLDSAFSSHPL